jgi:hypothetical protein
LTEKLPNSTVFGTLAPAKAQQPRHAQGAITSPSVNYEPHLKILVATIFLPEGLSLVLGDFRLPLVRVLLILLLLPATLRFIFNANSSRSVVIPSDIFAIAAGIWIIMAGLVTGGFMNGIKGGGALALEFSGAYYVFRYLLELPDSSVRAVKFCGKLVIIVIGLALLDPLTGKPFTYDLVKGFTGYTKSSWEWAIEYQADTLYRNGLVRAMGPLEHSILFGAACAWIGILSFCTFPSKMFGKIVASICLIGVLASQAKGPLLAYIIALGLCGFYWATKQVAARWKFLGTLVATYVVFVFFYSASPIATLLRSVGLDPEGAWYRQAIWQTATPIVLRSPVFGVGLGGDWDWQANDALIGQSVDAFWLTTAMMFGIPGSLLLFLTIVGAFWAGPIDRSPHLSREEQRLSVALGLVSVTAVFLGFTVHFWGSSWILLGIIAGMRANLVAVAAVRPKR